MNKKLGERWQKRFIDEYVDSINSFGIEQTLVKFSEVKSEYLPSCFYKFFNTSSYSLSSLFNNSIYLSHPRSFNDPFDSYLCVEKDPYEKIAILESIEKYNLINNSNTNESLSEIEYDDLKSTPVFGTYQPSIGKKISFSSKLDELKHTKSDKFFIKLNSIEVEVFRKINKVVDQIRNTDFRITCFSNFNDIYELGKNTTMWSHYADNHQGFCVKYSNEFDNKIYRNVIMCGLYPVIYSSRVPKLTCRDFKALEANLPLEYTHASTFKKVYKSLITKSKYWNYEKEWRLVIGKENSTYLTNDTLPFTKIEEIFIGCRASASLALTLVNFAESNGIKIYIGKKSDEKYELDFFEIDRKRLKKDYFYDELRQINRLTEEKIRLRNSQILQQKFPFI